MKIIYATTTGNTQTIAELIKEGVEQAGVEAELLEASEVSVNDIINEEVIAFGSPACGVEELEESFEPLMEDLKDKLEGKKAALFGSYSWGDGEWLRTWEDRIQSFGAKLVVESLAVQESPDGMEEFCREFGKSLVHA